MAVSVNGSTIIFTAEGDEFPLPIKVKSIRWTNVTTLGHLLSIGESSTLGDTANVVYRDSANGANYSNGQLIERYYPNGLEITDLDSGQVQVVYS